MTGNLSLAPAILCHVEIILGSPNLDVRVTVRLSMRGSRWVAAAEIGGEPQFGLGRTAREALTASLSSMGREQIAILLADPGLFGASARLLEARRTSA